METALPLEYYLVLSAALFAIGCVGIMVKRNPIIMFMCVELMLNAVNLAFVAFGRYLDTTVGGTPHAPGGQIIVIFVMAVAAAEVAVGLGIIVSIFRNRDTINIDRMDVMRG